MSSGSPQIEVAERLEEAALAELERRHPERPLRTNVEYYSAIVLDVAEVPPPLAPAMFACSRVAGWSAHILEQKRTGRLFRPSARYVGPEPAYRLRARMTLAEAAAEADALAQAGDERALAQLRSQWDEEIEAGARDADYRNPRPGLSRDRAVPVPAEARAPAERARGRQPGCARLGAHCARRPLARAIPATSTRSVRCSTISRRGTRTSRCGASRSSACGTARRSATRSSCSTASRTRTRRMRSCARRRARSPRCS